MALLMVQEGCQPLGHYDGYSSFAPLGGEVGVLISTGTNSDGYQVLAVRGATTGDTGPFFLVDDGLSGYGVLFGNTVVRTDTGFSSGADSGTRLGPTTYAASGKLTLWDKPGLYAVTLDALFDTETNLKAALPGAHLTVDASTGMLKLGNMAGGAGSAPLATVVQYKLDEALVTTGGAVVAHKKLVISFNPQANNAI
jgi:hypothetical protein